MLRLSEYISIVPGFWPFIAFIVGVLTKDYIIHDIPFDKLMIIIIAVVIIIIILSFFQRVIFEKINTLLLITGFLITGYAYSETNQKAIPKTGDEYILAEVVSLSSPKKASTHISLRILKIEKNDPIHKNRLFINAYFAPEQSSPLPQPGEVIIVKSSLQKISNAGNPYEFDYEKYLSLKNIYFTTYIKDEHWRTVSFKPFLSRFRLLSLKLKFFLQQKIKNIAKANDSLNHELMLAICTGDKSELDIEIKNSFSDAGAIHVMAVSGLHVGMIWVFLQYLTFFLKRSKSGKIIQFILIIIVLWFYAAMTGLSASVVRSASMFTIASLGGLLNRKAIIFNTLFIAAFIQVLINPKIIHDAGFQFSYAAVLSILLFHPPFSKILSSKNILIKRVLDLLNVSLSAQILTFPLAAYYFHQFPVYFLLTNLLIIPLVTLLMIFFLLSVLLMFIPYLSNIFLYSSLRITGLMEDSVEIVNKLPGNIIRNIDLSIFQTLIILLIPLIFLLFYYYRSFFYVMLGSILFLMNLCIAVVKYNYRDKSSLCVFNIRDGMAINIIHDDKNLLIHDDFINMQSIEYATSTYFTRKLYGEPDYLSLSEISNNTQDCCFSLPGENNYLYSTGTTTLALINDYSLFSKYTSGPGINIEIMILGSTPLPSLEEIQEHFHINKLILGSSIPTYIPDIQITDSTFCIYHRVSSDGAFIDEL